MKHLLILIVLVVVAYAAWQLADPKERRSAARLITHHGLRIGALVAVLLALMAAAVYLPGSKLL